MVGDISLILDAGRGGVWLFLVAAVVRLRADSWPATEFSGIRLQIIAARLRLEKRGQSRIVRCTLWAICRLVPAPFTQAREFIEEVGHEKQQNDKKFVFGNFGNPKYERPG